MSPQTAQSSRTWQREAQSYDPPSLCLSPRYFIAGISSRRYSIFIVGILSVGKFLVSMFLVYFSYVSRKYVSRAMFVIGMSNEVRSALSENVLSR